MSEIIRTSAGAMTEAEAFGFMYEHSVKQQRQLDAIALQLQMVAEEMTIMRKAVVQLEKVSPSQAQALGQAVRSRATSIASDWNLPEDRINQISKEIRREIRKTYEITSFKYLPRIMYEPALKRIEFWEEFDVLEGLRRE